jgi:hypothetical protein
VKIDWKLLLEKGTLEGKPSTDAKTKLEKIGDQDRIEKTVDIIFDWFSGGFMGQRGTKKTTAAKEAFSRVGNVYGVEKVGKYYRALIIDVPPMTPDETILRMNRGKVSTKTLQSWSSTKRGAKYFFEHFARDQNQQTGKRENKAWVLVSANSSDLNSLVSFEACIQFMADVAKVYEQEGPGSVQDYVEHLVMNDVMYDMHEMICSTVKTSIPFKVEEVLVSCGEEEQRPEPEFSNYDDFYDTISKILQESRVPLTDVVRTTTLEHKGNAQFLIQGKDIHREIVVTPIPEDLGILIKKASDLATALKNDDNVEIYRCIQEVLKFKYDFTKIMSSSLSLSNVPQMSTVCTPEQMQKIENFPAEFLKEDLPKLPRETREETVSYIRQAAEQLVCVTEALVYYTKNVDKENYYAGMNREEIVKQYEKALKPIESLGKVSGPFEGVSGETKFSLESDFAIWKIERDSKKIFVKATISPSLLRAEGEMDKEKGLSFAVLDANGEQSSENTFPLNSLREECEKALAQQ